MEASTVAQIACGVMGEEEEDDELGCPSSSSSGGDSNDSSEFMDDATSSPCSSPSSSSCCKSSPEHRRGTALFEMSSLMAQLPFKRGLSKHFQGKSRSFASLSGVTRLEDLAKPERPHKKRLRPCKSYGGGLDTHIQRPCAGAISKKPPGGAGAKQGFLGVGRPPVPPHRSGGFSA